MLEPTDAVIANSLNIKLVLLAHRLAVPCLISTKEWKNDKLRDDRESPKVNHADLQDRMASLVMLVQSLVCMPCTAPKVCIWESI